MLIDRKTFNVFLFFKNIFVTCSKLPKYLLYSLKRKIITDNQNKQNNFEK